MIFWAVNRILSHNLHSVKVRQVRKNQFVNPKHIPNTLNEQLMRNQQNYRNSILHIQNESFINCESNPLVEILFNRFKSIIFRRYKMIAFTNPYTLFYIYTTDIEIQKYFIFLICTFFLFFLLNENHRNLMQNVFFSQSFQFSVPMFQHREKVEFERNCSFTDSF